jgi:4-hydroxy-3-polyprenylbenzoate decarboxylase
MNKKRIIVGISGASGFQYGIKALQLLRDQKNIEIHLILTKSAEITRSIESHWKHNDVCKLADKVHHINDLSASISSGSFKTNGMLVAPCSMNSLASIATGLTNNLLTRAANVILKERRRLVLMVRETPLNMAHLRNMQYITEMGGIIYPPVPTFYQNPNSINDIVHYSVARSLDLFDINVSSINRWVGH